MYICIHMLSCKCANMYICRDATMNICMHVYLVCIYVCIYVCTHVYVCVYLYACLLVWCTHVSVMMWICMTCEYVWHVNMWQWAYWDAFSRVASGIPSEKQLIAEIWVLSWCDNERLTSWWPVWPVWSGGFLMRQSIVQRPYDFSIENLTFQGPKYRQYQLERIEGTRRYVVCKRLWFWLKHPKGRFFAR